MDNDCGEGRASVTAWNLPSVNDGNTNAGQNDKIYFHHKCLHTCIRSGFLELINKPGRRIEPGKNVNLGNLNGGREDSYTFTNWSWICGPCLPVCVCARVCMGMNVQAFMHICISQQILTLHVGATALEIWWPDFWDSLMASALHCLKPSSTNHPVIWHQYTRQTETSTALLQKPQH